MRVALLVLGSRGDVQPFVALGQGLKARGHHVRLATHGDFKPLVDEAGLEFRELPGSPNEFLNDPNLVEALQKGASLMRAARKVPKPSREHLELLGREVAAAGEGMDLIVNTLLSRIASFEETDIPWASTSWWPITATSTWPSVLFPPAPLGKLYNRFTHKLSTAVEWYMVNDYRKRMGLPSLGMKAPYGDLGRDRPLLYPVSPTVIATPEDWPARCHVGGYWFWDRDWTPSADLVSFLEGGPKPVALTFGSMWAVHPKEKTLEMVLDVVRKAGRRLVIVDGPEDNLPDDVFRVHDANYGWLFPRTAAVIHHGGCNTTGEALRAGVPQVVVPTFADTPYWASRMVALGVAAPPVPFPKLNAERLGASLGVALADTVMQETAARVGADVREERGVENACLVQEKWVAEHQVATV